MASSTTTRLPGHQDSVRRSLRRRLTVLAFGVTTGVAVAVGGFASTAQAAGTSLGAGTPVHSPMNPDSSSWS